LKYKRLTKEQLEELSNEFAQFLASQQIDKKEWDLIKKDKPEIVEEELDIFSDLVWEDVLKKVNYLEHYSNNQLNLFYCGKSEIERILIKINKKEFDFFDKECFQWFLKNQKDPSISYYKAAKKYNRSRNNEVFKIIEKGAVIAKGDLFKSIQSLVM